MEIQALQQSLISSLLKVQMIGLAYGGNFSEEMDITNEQMILASIGFSWGEGSMISFSSEFYRDAERLIGELENYEVVYLLRSKFTK